MPPVAAHRARIAPNVSRLGRTVPITCSSCGRIAFATSGGRLSLIPPMSCPVGSWIPTAPATNADSAATKMPNGKIANRNR